MSYKSSVVQGGVYRTNLSNGEHLHSSNTKAYIIDWNLPHIYLGVGGPVSYVVVKSSVRLAS